MSSMSLQCYECVMVMLMVKREKRVSAKRKRHDPVKLKMCSLSSARWAGEIHEIRIDTLRIEIHKKSCENVVNGKIS